MVSSGNQEKDVKLGKGEEEGGEEEAEEKKKKQRKKQVTLMTKNCNSVFFTSLPD